MSQWQIKKSILKGNVTIPSSKSQTLRALLFGALGNGRSIIRDYLHSPDTDAMLKACQLLGAKVSHYPNEIDIEGTSGKVAHAEDVIHAGNSGIVLRFCASVGALSEHPVVITGDVSIRQQRPMQPLLKALEQLGVKATSMRGDGYAPIIIQGPLRAGNATLSGEDSQPVSALLIASAFADGPINISVTNPGEKPWVALTLDWLTRLGISFENKGFERYRIDGSACYPGFDYRVPGDLSSMAFPVAAALITQSELSLNNVDMSDMQGDKELISIFRKMGAEIDYDFKLKKMTVKKRKSLSGIDVDINDMIDSITILAVVACFADSDTHIFNAAVAKQKECNRISGVATELRKMGADITETDDGLIIRPSKLRGATVYSHNDHRMAMSLAVAGMGAEGMTLVDSVDCVSKTYSTFMNDFQCLGAYIIEGGARHFAH